MARYRAKARLFLDRLIESGEEFSSDGVPGQNWDPIDDDAKAAVQAQFPNGLTPDPMKLQGKPLVAVPDGWRDLSAGKIIALAHKLGAPMKGTDRESAVAFIEREEVNRIHVAGDRAREAA